MIMNNYVADELANKVYHLHQALNQANKIISLLEEENKVLKVVIHNIQQNEETIQTKWTNKTFAA